MRLGGLWPNVSIQFWEATLRNYQEKGQTINYLRQITIAVITHTLINAYKSWGILPQSVPAKRRQCYAANLKENTYSASKHSQATHKTCWSGNCKKRNGHLSKETATSQWNYLFRSFFSAFSEVTEKWNWFHSYTYNWQCQFSVGSIVQIKNNNFCAVFLILIHLKC